MKKKLFDTYPKLLVEASPYDRIWGIGLDRYQEEAWSESTWRGLNLLGYILTDVRNELMKDDGMMVDKQYQVIVNNIPTYTKPLFLVKMPFVKNDIMLLKKRIQMLLLILTYVYMCTYIL